MILDNLYCRTELYLLRLTQTGQLDVRDQMFAGTIGVFHGVAVVARATPGLMELPSTGNGIEVSR